MLINECDHQEPNSVKSETRLDLGSIPKDVGWLLVGAGIVGEVAPGVLGTPFWLAGLFILCPSKARHIEKALEKHAPKALSMGYRQVSRFLIDLERRYPRLKSA